MLFPEISETETDDKLIPHSILDVEYDPDVIYRYPEIDYPGVPLPPRSFDFIFPEPMRLSKDTTDPEFRGFVLTDAESNKLYGIYVLMCCESNFTFSSLFFCFGCVCVVL